MKNLKTIALAFIVAIGALNASAQTNKKIDTKKSSINWVGKKVTGQHSGTINFSEGTIIVNGKSIRGGSFTVDMTSINTTDLEAGKGKEKLDGHLKADDFFGVEKYKTAKLEIKLISDNGDGTFNVTANLTIKDQTNPINFVLKSNGKNTASASLKVDRTKYGIKYGSGSFFEGLGDKAISDEFELNVNLVY
jgi:polyisoprenoid-binding protein YceI